LNLYAKVECSICGKIILGRDIETNIGSGFFEEPICTGCVKTNYCWATKDELITEYEKEKFKNNRKINDIILDLGGILSLD
jgi:hypothetical protein